MKEQIKEICNKLNREQLSVHGATEELLNLFSVSGCSLDELKMLKDHYADRTDRQGKSKNYREAHEDDIRKGTVEHIIAIVNNR